MPLQYGVKRKLSELCVEKFQTTAIRAFCYVRVVLVQSSMYLVSELKSSDSDSESYQGSSLMSLRCPDFPPTHHIVILLSHINWLDRFSSLITLDLIKRIFVPPMQCV
jgi:hypothetical protein